MLEIRAIDLRTRNTEFGDIDFVIDQERLNSKYVGTWSREKHSTTMQDSNIAHLIIEKDDQPIGYLILTGILDHHTIEITRIVISEKDRGFGRAVLEAIKHFAFDVQKIHRLWLDVLDYNERAIALYKSVGFTYEGTLRDVDYFEDRYHSLHIFSILSNEYYS
ncbi:MAG: GNAT family N-acetyltransferase [Candidatus Heimdallarchaeota archaeon]|nr:GNAT family N-acetyltransferase [Candidatus Heimdallarchaeota archaeon]